VFVIWVVGMTKVVIARAIYRNRFAASLRSLLLICILSTALGNGTDRSRDRTNDYVAVDRALGFLGTIGLSQRSL
jgi:hypothetical protein